LHRGAANALAKSPTACRPPAIAWLWYARLIEWLRSAYFPLTDRISVYEVSRRPGLLKTFGNHEGNRLTVARHLGPGEHRMRFA